MHSKKPCRCAKKLQPRPSMWHLEQPSCAAPTAAQLLCASSSSCSRMLNLSAPLQSSRKALGGDGLSVAACWLLHQGWSAWVRWSLAALHRTCARLCVSCEAGSAWQWLWPLLINLSNPWRRGRLRFACTVGKLGGWRELESCGADECGLGHPHGSQADGHHSHTVPLRVPCGQQLLECMVRAELLCSTEIHCTGRLSQ